VDAAISFYECYCRTTQDRRTIYEAPTIAPRVKSLLHLLKQGTYTSLNSKDLGFAAFLLDAFVGVPFAARRPQRAKL
jgi:hypothetical protein